MFKLTTKNIEYIRYTYTLTDSYAKGFGAIYELKETSRPDSFLPNNVKIEGNLKISKNRDIDIWLLFGNSNKDEEQTRLILLKANETGKYYGEKLYKEKKSFLLIQLSKDNKTLIIDSFRGFYPRPSKSYIYSYHQFKF